MKTNPLRLPFYIYIYLYMYTQTSADINRRLKPQKKKSKNLLLYYQKLEFLKSSALLEAKVVKVSHFQITEVFAGLLQIP